MIKQHAVEMKRDSIFIRDENDNPGECLISGNRVFVTDDAGGLFALANHGRGDDRND